ncbi:hypothetical protein ACQBAT_01715 [Ornithinimicrobium sp. Y1847]|uniref:hypothetical protein n=1 Tax=unclassified Ornithinimicrobium TaxID=2615080 RepID=UPI003B674D23
MRLTSPEVADFLPDVFEFVPDVFEFVPDVFEFVPDVLAVATRWLLMLHLDLPLPRRHADHHVGSPSVAPTRQW